jgi:hypothetical protein
MCEQPDAVGSIPYVAQRLSREEEETAFVSTPASTVLVRLLPDATTTQITLVVRATPVYSALSALHHTGTAHPQSL